LYARGQAEVLASFFRTSYPSEWGVFVASSRLMTNFPSLVIRLAERSRLPVSGHRKEWAEQGALFSYGANFRSIGRDAARLVDKILKGAKPADLPIERV